MRFKQPLFLVLALLLVVGLAACSGQATEAPADTGGAAAPAGESEAPAAVAEATAAPVEEEPAESAVSVNGPAGCQAFSAIPEPNATLEAIFPPPGANDHVKGAEDAIVTIIEYSDFQ